MTELSLPVCVQTQQWVKGRSVQTDILGEIFAVIAPHFEF